MIAPKAIPPTTSVTNKDPTLIAVTLSTPSAFTFNNVRKRTTPIPSLNKDSPAILVSVVLDKFIFFTIDKTAIGSVGAIREPNSKQSTYEIPK